MHQVRAIALSPYLDIAKLVSIDGHKLLAEAGIKVSDLEDGETRLSAAAVAGLLEKSAAEADRDSFGLLLAQGRSFASLGPLSLLLQHLDTVRGVVEEAIAFRRHLNDVCFLALEQGAEVSVITLDLMPPYRRPQATDLVVGAGCMMLRAASGGRWAPETVHFTREAPRDRAPFDAFFRAPLEFASSFNGLSCSTRSLDIPLPFADRTMANNARRLLHMLRLRPEHAPLLDHTKQSIVVLLSSGRATLEAVAARLGQTPRSLQRHLEEESRTFRDLLNEVRRELAEQYLAGPQPLIEISDQLGYATPSSFTRWFNNEFGSSPSGWREAQRKMATGPSPLWKV